MFKNSSMIMFNLMLIMSTLITISANSWMSAWIGLEINLLSFTPMMSKTNNLMSNESTMKYFIIQAMASAMMMWCVIIYMLKFNFIYTMNIKSLLLSMIMSSLLLKSGIAPFHFWFPSVMEGLSWMNNLILMTWQKISPLMLISYLNFNKLMILLTIIMSSLIGSFGGLNQTSLRKMMAFSSINHMSWMLTAMMFNSSSWMLYFMIYSFLSMNIVMLLNIYQLYHMTQMFTLIFYNNLTKVSIMVSMLSLGGLPPFLGFMPKWIIIHQLSTLNQFSLMMIMTISTLITLYFYLRMCYSTFILNYYEMNWNFIMFYNNFMKTLLLLMSFISMTGLLMINMLYLI